MLFTDACASSSRNDKHAGSLSSTVSTTHIGLDIDLPHVHALYASLINVYCTHAEGMTYNTCCVKRQGDVGSLPTSSRRIPELFKRCPGHSRMFQVSVHVCLLTCKCMIAVVHVHSLSELGVRNEDVLLNGSHP